MRKLSLIFILFFTAFSVFAQTEIEISFDINQNGSQLLLDSVLIENTTNSTDTMIYYPETSIEIDMISGIDDHLFYVGELFVKQNYPNPFDDKTFIEVYSPEKSLNVIVTDYAGKKLFAEKYNTEIGLNKFIFTPGSDSQYIVSFMNKRDKETIKLLHSGKNGGKVDLRLVNTNQNSFEKASKLGGFTFTDGESLEFTSYATACENVVTSSTNGSPSDDITYTFDYTNITNIQPDRPVRIAPTVSETSIVFDWDEVSGADGYKYNFENNYEEATDLGTITEYELDDLTAGTNHQLFVWAYNDCGESFPLNIVEATTALPFTTEENDHITAGSASEDFVLMSICQQPDSVILRTVSTNVDLEEENLILLKDRMKSTVLGEGVGIAAPQIGINRNVIWVQRYDKGGALIKPWEVYYNPVIIAYSDTVALRNDGCLSVPDDCVTGYSIEGNSYRAIWVDVQYYDEDFNLVRERIDHQYTAHIFQHEIDHLNGIMYFDRQVEENPDKYVIIEGDSYDGLPVID